MKPVNILMVGARGRMGRTIIELAERDPRFAVTAAVDQGDDLFTPVAAADAVIDFSHHSVTLPLAEHCAQLGRPLVIGTTGHSDELRAKVLRHGEKIPLILATNFAVGVNTLFYLTRIAANILGSDYDQEIVEMHHRHKKDAPSGTAKTLAEILAEVKGAKLDELARHGRVGEPGERTRDEIGIHALRGGDVVGEHTVYFAGEGERLELTIRSSSRDSYASGALRAAAWLQGKPAGSYSMADVLGLA